MTGALWDTHADRATKLISSLGGPSLEQRDIEWANDLEVGRLLLGWLSSQIQISGDDDGLDAYSDENDSDNPKDARNAGSAISAAMRDSTLEVDEVTILKDERVSQHVAQAQDLSEYRSDCMPPSQLGKHADFIASETSNVQQEANLFRARISQTREASKKISTSIKLLQQAVYDLNTKLRGSEETLSELSITADTAIASTISSSQELLRELGMPFAKGKDNVPPPAANDDYADLEAARNILSKSKGNIAMLITRFEENMASLDWLRQQDASKAMDLQTEAGRLQSAFDALESGNRAETRSNNRGDSTSTATLDRGAITELQVICDTLEKEVAHRDQGQVSGSGALDGLLSELHDEYVADKGANVQNMQYTIQDQLRQAWASDQAAILQLHEEALDETTLALDAALAPLEQVHKALSRLARCIQEAEAVLEACAEELADIYLPDSLQSKDKSSRSRSQEELEDAEMEQRIKDALNDCKDLRPDAAPLVLPTREDILAELRSLKVRSARVEASERTWADAVIQKYSIRPIHPLLPQIYAHAPTNTSPPFAFPAHVRALEARARSRAADLQRLAQAVDGEAREAFAKAGTVKRLDAFVERWTEEVD